MNWDLLADLVLLSDVFGDSVVVLIGRGVRGYIAPLSVSVSWSSICVSEESSAWLRFNTISRVVGVVSLDYSVDWDI
jgi:hypothetical protein